MKIKYIRYYFALNTDRYLGRIVPDIVISAVSLTLSSVYFIIFLQNFTGGRHGNSSYCR